jgi:hypothetical protein
VTDTDSGGPTPEAPEQSAKTSRAGRDLPAAIAVSLLLGGTIIAIFGQWGASQLLLVGALWVLLLRYRGLLPFILCVLLLEPFLRALSGHLKPLMALGTAPGAALNWFAVPVLAATLYLALCAAEERRS